MEKEKAWNYAIGMVEVDGLTPSTDMKEWIEQEKRGELTTKDIKQKLDDKYKGQAHG